MKMSLLDRVKVGILKSQGLSQSMVCETLGRSKHFVETWWNREKIEDRERSGRPIKMTRSTINKLSRQIQKKPRSSTRNLARKFSISPRSATITLKSWSLKPLHRPKVNQLTPLHMKRRLKFAQDHIQDDWSKTLFTDEKEFVVADIPNRHNDIYWVRSRDQLPIQVKAIHPVKLNVSAGISCNGKTSLHIFSNIMDSDVYECILRKTLIPGGKKLFGHDWRLLSDNDPKHKSNQCLDLLAEKKVPRVEFPSKSPDINTIENLWSILNENIMKDPPRTKDELEKKLKKEWAKIDPNLLKKMVESMPRRLQAVIKARGDMTKY